MRRSLPVTLVVLVLAGCYRAEDPRWTAAQKDTRPAVSKEAVAGSKLKMGMPPPKDIELVSQ